MTATRFIAIALLILITIYGFSQKIQDNEKIVLTYESGCRGGCRLFYNYEDSCNSTIVEIYYKQSIIEKDNLLVYENDSLVFEKGEELRSFFHSEKVNELKKILIEEEEENKYQFIPPKPKCYSYEYFKINFQSLKFEVWRIDGELNINGYALTPTENIVFDELQSIIRTVTTAVGR